MISRFFIDRPIFSAVLSIIIFVIGLASIYVLPVARFPEITPPTVVVNAFYPGADAQTVAESLAAPIEQELSGIEGLVYFQSASSNDGSARITATFEIGTDTDIAAVEVQNRLKRAEPRLPQESVRQGISVNKTQANILMVAAIKSTDPAHDSLFLGNYATINMLDTIRRVPGIGDANIGGTQNYSMRLWVNPDLLASKNLTVTDIATAVREQNGLYAAGRIGAAPNSGEVEMTLPVVTRGRLQSPEEFGDIVLRANSDGSFLYLRDVARIELSAQSFDVISRLDGVPTTFILTYLQPGANALNTTNALIATLDELQKSMPEGMYYEIPYNTTPFIRLAIEEVFHTFLEAMVLVSLVVLVFLGTWRASIIPLLAVPVAIVGTLGGMLLLGFSINSLTLFGLVLAIGIVVDDAIIVVENVERIMHEDHLPVREATIKAMEQVSGPIIAIVLVLSSVFLPVGFLGGLTGELYRQFAITIAVSVMISGVVALTLSPALCVVLLKKEGKKLFLFRWFDWAFDKFTWGYSRFIKQTIRFGVVTLAIFGIMIWATFQLWERVPSGFIPQEDQGYFIVAILLPEGASLNRTAEVMTQVEDFLKQQPEVDHVVSLGGLNLLGGFTPSTNAALMFVPLKPWDEREGEGQDVNGMVGRVFGFSMGIKEALILPINPPPVQGLGMRAGFEYQLQNRSGSGVAELAEAMNTLVAAASQRPELQGINATLSNTLPQLRIDLDRERTKAYGVDINGVYDTLQALLGSLYVNDFIQSGRIFRVQLQAESEYRQSPEAVTRIYVRNGQGEMVPLSGLVSMNFQSGPNLVSRFNGFPAVQVTGEPAPGYSTGDAIRVMEEVSRQVLPPGFSFEWSGASYQEIKAGGQAPYIIGFGLFIVFLVLCALYERWSLPIAVLLGIPSGAFGAILALYLRRYLDPSMARDIYFQIGLLTLIGLAAKNAILIVEFAATLREQGQGIREAAVNAARIRLRPFIMTSMAFILGVLPLVIAEGAGAAGRHSIGTGVMGGMFAATFLDMFFVPLFFVMVAWTSELWTRRKKGQPVISQSQTEVPKH